MSNVNEKMTALADEVRELNGDSGKKSIDTMTTNLNSANSTITNQTALINRIRTALDGKAGGSGGIPEGYIKPAGNFSIINNGEYNIAVYETVTVNVPSESGGDSFVIPAGTYKAQNPSDPPYLTPSFYSTLPEEYTASANISGSTYLLETQGEVVFDKVEMYYRYESMNLDFYSGDARLGHHHLYDGGYYDITISNDTEVDPLFYLIFMDLYGGGDPFKGEFSDDVDLYNKYDIVVYKGDVYRFYDDFDTSDPRPIEAYPWTKLNTGVYRDEFNYELSYQAGDVVMYENSLYVCIKDTTGGSLEYIPYNSEYWTLIHRCIYKEPFKGEYDDTIAYKQGDIIKYQGNIYQCGSDMNEGGHNPVDDPIYWSSEYGRPINSTYRGEYSASDKYNYNDIVTYQGNVYQSRGVWNADNDHANPENHPMLWGNPLNDTSLNTSALLLAGSYYCDTNVFPSSFFPTLPYGITAAKITGRYEGSYFGGDSFEGEFSKIIITLNEISNDQTEIDVRFINNSVAQNQGYRCDVYLSES